MGNIITQDITNTPRADNLLNTSTNTINTNSDTILGDYIYSWALNHYSINSISPNSGDPLYYTDQLKKRACCTKSSSVSIGLPGLSSLNADNIHNTSPNLLLLDQYRVTIPIFPEPMLPEYCKNLQSNYGIKSPSFLRQDNILLENATSDCQNFYGNFCQEVRKNRKTYSNIFVDQLYGPNSDPTIVALTKPQNAYIDCNCENSFIKILDGYVPPGTTPNTGAQMIDNRCANNVGGKSWVVSDQRIKELCISNMQIGSISATDRAKINITQICELNGNTNTSNNALNASAAEAAAKAADAAANAAAIAAGDAAAAAAAAAGANSNAIANARNAAAAAAGAAARNGANSSDVAAAGAVAGARVIADLRDANDAAASASAAIAAAVVAARDEETAKVAKDARDFNPDNVKIYSSNTTTTLITPEPKKTYGVIYFIISIIVCFILFIIIIRKRIFGSNVSSFTPNFTSIMF